VLALHKSFVIAAIAMACYSLLPWKDEPESKEICGFSLTRAMVLEQRIDGIGRSIEELDKKLEALQKGNKLMTIF